MINIPDDMLTNDGESLKELSIQQPILLVFLRHFGCIFCREALKDLSQRQDKFKIQNVKLVFVHMADPEIAYAYFKQYKLGEVSFVTDQECKFYERFGLVKGSFNQLFGLQNWIRGFEATMKGAMIGIKQIGDGFQMPGVFYLENGKIKDQYIHNYASDKPNYDQMVNCCAN